MKIILQMVTKTSINLKHSFQNIFFCFFFSYLDVEFKKQILRNIMYLKVELKHVVTNQSEMLEKLQTIEKELQ